MGKDQVQVRVTAAVKLKVELGSPSVVVLVFELMYGLATIVVHLGVHLLSVGISRVVA